MRNLQYADRLDRIERALRQSWTPPIGSLRKWYFRLSIQVKRYLVWAAISSDDGRLNTVFFHLEPRFANLRPPAASSVQGVQGIGHFLSELPGVAADLLSNGLGEENAMRIRRNLHQIKRLGDAHLDIVSGEGDPGDSDLSDTLPLLKALRAFQLQGGLPEADLARHAERLLPGMDPAERAWFFTMLLDVGERILEGPVWETLIRLGMQTGGLCLKGEPGGQISVDMLLRVSEGLLEADHLDLLSELLAHFEGKLCGPEAVTAYGYALARSKIAQGAYRESIDLLESLPQARGKRALKLSSLMAMCLSGLGEFERLREELRALMRKTRQATGLSRRFRGGMLVFAEIMMDTARDMPESVWEYDLGLMDKRKFVYERDFLMRLLAEKSGTKHKV